MPSLTLREQLQGWLANPGQPSSVPLPEVEAPSLDGLSVEVATPAPVDKPTLLARYEAFVRACSPRRPRAGGEALAAGDDAIIDVMGWVGDRLLPLSTHGGLAVALLPAPPIPAFYTSLVGLRVGSRQRVDVMLPFDYPLPLLRGEIASFDVAIRAGAEVLLLDPEADGFIQALGRGPTLPDVMSSLIDEIEAERQQAALDAAREAALAQLAARAPVEIPDALVDHELSRRWAAHEGPLLLERQVPDAALEVALRGWLDNPGLREDARRRLHISVVLGAVARRDGVRPTRENIGPYLAPIAASLGLDLDGAMEALRQDPAFAAAALAQIHHQLVVDHVLSRVLFHPAVSGEAS